MIFSESKQVFDGAIFRIKLKKTVDNVDMALCLSV